MPSKTRRLRRIADELKTRRGPCFLCGHPIDYSLSHDDEMAFTVEHIMPRSTHPELAEDPGNCVPAHAKCNKSRGDRDHRPGLGVLSNDW